MAETIIAPLPPEDGRDWDCSCARCGSSVTTEECETCGGDGETQPGEIHEQDPLWYDEEDTEPCGACLGASRWRVCLSSEEWCLAHPLPGREAVERGSIEWFTRDAQAEVVGG